MFWLFDAVWNDSFIPFENSLRSGLLKIHFVRHVSDNAWLSWLFLCSSHIKMCFLTRYFWWDGCWQINSLWYFHYSCLPWSCLVPWCKHCVCRPLFLIRVKWFVLVSSLQNVGMWSIELDLNYLARLWVHDQLYRICCILAEYWSFGSVIFIVCCFYHFFHSAISCHIWSTNVVDESVVPFLETG